MFIYPKILKDRGVTEDALKAAFDKPVEEMSDKPKALRRLIVDRICDGRDSQIKNWRAISAIDKAYDVAHSQLAPTLIRDITSHDYTPKQVFEKLEAYGLEQAGSTMLDLERDEHGGYKDNKIESPSFFKVLVPLVKAYVTIRLAKLFGDNNTFPLLKYSARRYTAENRIRAEIVTDMVNTMASNYGYKSTMRQAIFQMLMYSNCLQFPREVWHSDKQLNEQGDVVKTREGIRYHTPRPERTFFDRHYPTSSFNTDTGCEWAGYWQVERFGAVSGNKNYWNTDRIKKSVGENADFFQTAVYKQYFTELYPCGMKWPDSTAGGPNSQDREGDAAYYTTNEDDKAVVITTFYMKLCPKDWDLGDYDYKIWFRFIIANDDKIIFAQPILYPPVIYWGYDADMNRVTSPSMALEVLPWQDHTGNVISQILLSSKQNLANAVFFDKNIVSADVLNQMSNKRESQLRGINFVPFDSMKDFRAGLDSKSAFHEFRFSKHDIGELTGTLSTIISIMERLLVMSAQEIGGAASHEQSAREVAIIAGNTGTRVAYTGTFIDDAKSAWRRQIYYAIMAYMEENFPSQIDPNTFQDAKKVMLSMGIEVSDEPYGYGSSTVGIKVEKSKLKLEGFAEDRDVVNRLHEPAIATVMFQTLGMIASNQMLAEQVGPAKILEGFTMAAHLAGAPPDWELEPSEDSSKLNNAQEIAEQLKGMINQIVQEAAGQAVDAVTEPIQSNTGKIEEISTVLGQLLEAVGSAPPVPQGNTPL